jgi:hypothetical protein
MSIANDYAIASWCSPYATSIERDALVDDWRAKVTRCEDVARELTKHLDVTTRVAAYSTPGTGAVTVTFEDVSLDESFKREWIERLEQLLAEVKGE